MGFDWLRVPIEDNHFWQITIDAIKILNVVTVNVASSVTEEPVHDITIRIQSV